MFRTFAWPLVAVLGLISAPIVADDSATTKTETDTENPTATGVQVFIDEQTGEVRSPTAAETAVIAEQFRRQYIDLAVDKPVVYHADGSISKELGTLHRMYTVARITDDGELEARCLPAGQAADFLANGDKVSLPADIEVQSQAGAVKAETPSP